MIGSMADGIEFLKAEIEFLKTELDSLRSLINAWADADDDPEDVDGVYHSAWLNLREAVKR